MMGSGANFASIAKQLHKKTGKGKEKKRDQSCLVVGLDRTIKKAGSSRTMQFMVPNYVFTIHIHYD